MNSIFTICSVFCFSLMTFGQEKEDTIYIMFDEQHEEMRKIDFTTQVQAGSPNEKLKRSIDYFIEQMEPPDHYDNEFNFTHVNRSQNDYEMWNLTPPLILKKKKSFLKGKEVLDIQFFRKILYIEVCKTFEEEDSWEEDVMIFIVDVDEMKNDSIVLRQVDFSRPVKQ